MIKNVFVIMFVILMSVIGCNREQSDGEEVELQEEKMKTIVAVGDSLTAGFGVNEEESYPALLEEKLRADGYKYQVINAGVSGETSSGTLSRMEWILTLEPDIVILETGANDGLRGIDPQLAEANIRKILQLLKKKDVVVLLTGMKMVWNMGPIYVAKFNSIYPLLAKEFDHVFMPFFLEGVAMKKQLTIGDGVHPNAKGYQQILNNIYPYVLEAIEKSDS